MDEGAGTNPVHYLGEVVEHGGYGQKAQNYGAQGDDRRRGTGFLSARASRRMQRRFGFFHWNFSCAQVLGVPDDALGVGFGGDEMPLPGAQRRLGSVL